MSGSFMFSPSVFWRETIVTDTFTAFIDIEGPPAAHVQNLLDLIGIQHRICSIRFSAGSDR